MEELRQQAAAAWRGGADCVELRIDEFHGDPGAIAAYLESHDQRTWILTCRSVAEGGSCADDPPERAKRLKQARGRSGAVIDFEYADFRTSSDLRESILGRTGVSNQDARVGILSHHAFDGGPPDVPALGGAMTRLFPPMIPKIAYSSQDITDTFAALDAMHAAKTPLIAVAMDEAGAWTRVLAGKFGAFGTYATLDPDGPTAPGQISLARMMAIYRWNRINAETAVFGVLGDPVAHSMGPQLFNDWFELHGVNAVYLTLTVSQATGCLKRFLDGCRRRPWLDIGGFSVTIPHKEAVLAYAASGADGVARSIGAANTLVVKDETWTAHNTDSYAAIDALCGSLACDRRDLAGLSAAVLGCGGAARAVLAGLQACGCRTTVYGRAPEKTHQVAKAFDAAPKPWTERAQTTCDLLVNATPIGMSPRQDASPMPLAGLKRQRLVFDLIYNPLETKLLLDARSRGVATLGGLEMFVRQAAAQFELWTGQTPNLAHARHAVTQCLSQEPAGKTEA